MVFIVDNGKPVYIFTCSDVNNVLAILLGSGFYLVRATDLKLVPLFSVEKQRVVLILPKVAAENVQTHVTISSSTLVKINDSTSGQKTKINIGQRITTEIENNDRVYFYADQFAMDLEKIDNQQYDTILTAQKFLHDSLLLSDMYQKQDIWKITHEEAKGQPGKVVVLTSRNGLFTVRLSGLDITGARTTWTDVLEQQDWLLQISNPVLNTLNHSKVSDLPLSLVSNSGLSAISFKTPRGDYDVYVGIEYTNNNMGPKEVKNQKPRAGTNGIHNTSSNRVMLEKLVKLRHEIRQKQSQQKLDRIKKRNAEQNGHAGKEKTSEVEPKENEKKEAGPVVKKKETGSVTKARNSVKVNAKETGSVAITKKEVESTTVKVNGKDTGSLSNTKKEVESTTVKVNGKDTGSVANTKKKETEGTKSKGIDNEPGSVANTKKEEAGTKGEETVGTKSAVTKVGNRKKGSKQTAPSSAGGNKKKNENTRRVESKTSKGQRNLKKTTTEVEYLKERFGNNSVVEQKEKNIHIVFQGKAKFLLYPLKKKQDWVCSFENGEGLVSEWDPWDRASASLRCFAEMAGKQWVGNLFPGRASSSSPFPHPPPADRFRKSSLDWICTLISHVQAGTRPDVDEWGKINREK